MLCVPLLVLLASLLYRHALLAQLNFTQLQTIGPYLQFLSCGALERVNLDSLQSLGSHFKVENSFTSGSVVPAMKHTLMMMALMMNTSK